MKPITMQEYQRHLKFVQHYEAENEVPVEVPKVKRYVLAPGPADPAPQNMQQIARQLFNPYDTKRRRMYHKPQIVEQSQTTMADQARSLWKPY